MKKTYEKINIKVTHEQKVALRNLASDEGEAMSVVVRRLISKEAKKHGLWPEQIPYRKETNT